MKPAYKLPLLLVASLSVGLLSGCGSLDLGSAHHRRWGGDGQTMLHARYLTPAEARANTPIKIGDSITITVQSVFIKDFWEANILRKKLGLGDDSKRGEIAVVASIGPLKRNEAVQATSDGARSGRIYYYAEAVPTQVYLPVFNVPIYGPIMYDGSPISVSFHIVELDQKEDARTKAMVQTLAKLGSASYPPSSPVLKALEQVGSSLLSGNNDDLIFTYAGVLFPVSDQSTIYSAYLTAGHLVIIRPEASSLAAKGGQPTNWQDLKLEHGTGLLTDSSTGKYYIDASYVVLGIDRGQPSVELDAAETLASFTERLNAGDSTPAAIVESGAGIVDALKKDQNRAQALAHLAKIRASLESDGAPPAASLQRLQNYLTSSGDSEESLRSSDRQQLLDMLRDLTGNAGLEASNIVEALKSVRTSEVVR